MKRIALIAALASTSLLASNASADNTETPQDAEQAQALTEIMLEEPTGEIASIDIEQAEQVAYGYHYEYYWYVDPCGNYHWRYRIIYH